MVEICFKTPAADAQNGNGVLFLRNCCNASKIRALDICSKKENLKNKQKKMSVTKSELGRTSSDFVTDFRPVFAI